MPSGTKALAVPREISIVSGGIIDWAPGVGHVGEEQLDEPTGAKQGEAVGMHVTQQLAFSLHQV